MAGWQDYVTAGGLGQSVTPPPVPQAPPVQGGLGQGMQQAPAPTDPFAEFPVATPANRADWDKRADGSSKGMGFLGLRQRPDGSVSSEISVGVNLGGKEVEIPTMVPTLTPDELHWLMTNDPGKSRIPPSIIQKAVDHAKARIHAGLSPFRQDDEPDAFTSTVRK